MQEVLYNAIRITKNDDSVIKARVKDAAGQYITSGDMKLVIALADDVLFSIDGTYDNVKNEWSFTIPPTQKLEGRYMYHFQYEGIYLDFPNPIYFI